MAQQSTRERASDPVARAFATLEDVAQPARTQWSIVYDAARRPVYWHTRENIALRSVSLAGFDPSCAAPTMLLGIHEGAGDVSERFRPYRSEDNERLLIETVRATPFLAGIDDTSLHQPARWPDSSVCRMN